MLSFISLNIYVRIQSKRRNCFTTVINLCYSNFIQGLRFYDLWHSFFLTTVFLSIEYFFSFSDNAGDKADDFPTEHIQIVFAHMSPLIQNTMRTPTESSHIVMLTGMPISKLFNTQWLPNSDYILKTNPSTTTKTNKDSHTWNSFYTTHILMISEFSDPSNWYNKISKQNMFFFFLVVVGGLVWVFLKPEAVPAPIIFLRFLPFEFSEMKDAQKDSHPSL